MRAFFLKGFVFLLVGAALYLGVYRACFQFHHWLRTKKDPQALYILGDSRTVHGIDLNLLKRELGREVHSHATHGASVYIMYAMADVIPDGAEVILAPSLGTFARHRELVSYKAGLDVGALLHMAEIGYSSWFYSRILEQNRYPFASPHRDDNFGFEVFEVTETPDLVNIERFHQIFLTKTRPEHMAWNVALFQGVVDRLLDKGCTVHVVEFPVTPELTELREASIFRPLLEEVPAMRDARLDRYSDIQLRGPPGKNIWHDMDHLNELGMTLMTELVLRDMLDHPVTSSVPGGYAWVGSRAEPPAGAPEPIFHSRTSTGAAAGAASSTTAADANGHAP